LSGVNRKNAKKTKKRYVRLKVRGSSKTENN